MFVDVDEYLYIKKNRTLLEFLTDIKFKKCENIHINYREFGDSDLLNYDKRPLFIRFVKTYRFSPSIKTFVRGGIKNAIMDIHRSYNIKYYCNSEGKIIIPSAYDIKELSIENAEIKHYITKTIDEFVIKLIKGWPIVELGSIKYYNFLKHRIKYFFGINKLTKDKFIKIYPFIKDDNLTNIYLKKLNCTKNELKKINSKFIL